MQSLTRRHCSGRHCSRYYLKEFQRRTTSFSTSTSRILSDQLLINDPDSSVLVEENVSSRTVILNRPSVLNALNVPMMSRLHKLYKTWEDNPNVGFVVMKGNGRAFSAGADLVSLHNMIKNGNNEGSKEIFRKAYSFAYLLHTYSKPNVAILHGITMGGGAVISVPGNFRIATEKTVFATPETLIGLHPDGGASFHLSRLPGYLGEYLGLTGDSLNGAEMIACGLATHYSHSANVREIEECLKNLRTNDSSLVKTSIEKYSDFVYPDNNSVLNRMEIVDKCFGCDSVEEIIDALITEAAKTKDGWFDSTLKKLKYASPLSLKISLRSIREGRLQTLEQCLVREFRMSSRATSCEISDDFCEGIRARMVDKDFKPKWSPLSLAHVSEDMVDHYFSPLGPLERELEFPTKQREGLGIRPGVTNGAISISVVQEKLQLALFNNRLRRTSLQIYKDHKDKKFIDL